MHDVVIIGAGIHGLCAAFELRRRGRDVVVLDRFDVGHDRGGSHGAARITRSSYHERAFVQMAQRTQQEGWPELGRELGRRLVHPTPGVFFGPPHGLFGEFLSATMNSGVAVEQIRSAEAAAKFDLLRFAPDDVVMLDHTAGVIAAADAMAGLREWLVGNGTALLAPVTAKKLVTEPRGITIETDGDTLRANNVVVAMGAWLGELLPEWRQPVTVLRQEVGYFDVDCANEATAVGTFPVWCRIGKTAEDFIYGLPEFGQPGLKLARHRTTGSSDDPNSEPEPIDRAALTQLAEAHLSVPVREVLAAENCLYAVLPGEELRVARSEVDPRIVAVAACSGHGFKFGPMIGRAVADLLAVPPA